MKKQTKEKNFKTYVICRMYAGKHLETKMGGEVINLLHDDNGNNYVYINPHGYINDKYNNTVQAVVLTELKSAGCFEVLAIAKIGENGQLVFPKGYKIKERMKSSGEQLKIKEKELNIRYSGKLLSEIYDGELDGTLTFKSDVLLQPKNPIFISDSKKKYESEFLSCQLKDKRFPNRSLVCYVTDNEHKEAFNTIKQLIDNEDLWDTDRKNKVNKNTMIDEHFNFLKVIEQEDNELVFSNLFAYVFNKYPDLLRDFCQEVLEIKITEVEPVEREIKNIDLLIKDKDNIIVIENKIKSGINGVSPRHDFSENGFVQSQLSKYYSFATAKAKELKKTAHFFIFLPNYSSVDITKYEHSKNYTKKTYEEIYKFFEKRKKDDAYYKEFVKCLYKHTKDREKDYYEDMQRRFLAKINHLNK